MQRRLISILVQVAPSKTRSSRPSICSQCTQFFSTSRPLLSGHSKWSKIKHDKGTKDKRKSKILGSLSNDIANASRMGGPNPVENNTLAAAIAKAKANGMVKASIDAAIMRGQGKSATGAALEALTLEAVAPPVALIIECETDKKGQLLQEVRQILKLHGATVTPTAYMFERRGRVTFEGKQGIGVDEVLDEALELGALDVDDGPEGGLVVDTEPSALKQVEISLAQKFQIEVESSETLWIPNEDTAVSTADQATLSDLGSLVEKLEDYPGIEAVYTNFRETAA